MMRKLAVLLLVLIAIPAVQASSVEEISNFKITVKIDGTAHVRYDITIKNLIDKPVVPGIGEIRLQKVQPLKIGFLSLPFTEERVPVKVRNLKVYSEGKEFKSSVEDRGDYTTIVYEIWYPIEPHKSLNFTVEYDADIVDSGILFKSVTIPVGADTNIRKLEINVDSSWKLCYTEPKSSGSNPLWTGSIPAGGIAFYTAEFSILPLPMLPVRGYIAFWGTLLFLFAISAIAGLKRK
ncbi:hypothetical protein [Archaeoglobus neptunius]|uniref:hypothetical protein n=1 Tax=Archaeoglobus neptunius TaxID=2798580 RepID=UPI001925A0E3|nr:hypothetical protein [Archaeoglobus neptunius]